MSGLSHQQIDRERGSYRLSLPSEQLIDAETRVLGIDSKLADVIHASGRRA